MKGHQKGGTEAGFTGGHERGTETRGGRIEVNHEGGRGRRTGKRKGQGGGKRERGDKGRGG
jgi:hypothetical protein